MREYKRNVILLALSHALMMSGSSLMITTAALIGSDLAFDKSLATLPLTAIFLGVLVTSIPASYLMERIGRKRGFLFSVLFGVTGAMLATYAVFERDFWLFVAGAALIGIFNGFGNYYRFAAAEAVDESFKSRAVSYVLAGGVLAAVVGPNLASYTRDMIATAQFAGSYIALVCLYLLSFITLSFLRLPEQVTDATSGLKQTGRPLREIVKQSKFIAAIICGMMGYGVMNLVMTATPLAMHHEAHMFSDTAFVIQWHVLGMFVPSFFTGGLIERFGVYKIMFIGGLLGLACVGINLVGTSVVHFWAALLFLGISWNFLFVGATVLLTTTYRREERAKTQALNDFVIFTTVAIASLTSGALQHTFGWQVVNLGVIPLLVIILASILWAAARDKQQQSSVSTNLLHETDRL